VSGRGNTIAVRASCSTVPSTSSAKLKIVILEVGAGWGAVLARPHGCGLRQRDGARGSAHGKAQLLFQTQRLGLRRSRREIIACRWSSLCGSDRFFWATDFPHPDHTGNYIEDLEEFGNKLSDPQRRRDVLGDNVRRVYNSQSDCSRDPNLGSNRRRGSRDRAPISATRTECPQRLGLVAERAGFEPSVTGSVACQMSSLHEDSRGY